MLQNGIQLPGAMPMPIAVTAPLNDVQLTCLMATQCPGDTPSDKATYAILMIEEVLRQVKERQIKE